MPRSPGAILKAAALTAALLVFAPLPAPAQSADVVLTTEQAFAAARADLRAGNTELAEAVADAVLAADPDNAAALNLRAAVAQARGQYLRAAEAAGRAYQTATDSDRRFEAAMLAANANFALSRYGWARLWLRLASEVAPNDAARALIEANYRQATAASPFRNRLTFSVSPSSNVNNGSSDRILEIGGIPFILSPDARALSGVRGRLQFTSRYRLFGSQRSETYLRGGVVIERVRLSDEARAEAPDARGSDYSYDAIELGFGRILAGQTPGRANQFDIAFGRNWYGGDVLSDFLRGSYRHTRPARGAAVLGSSLSVERQWRRDVPLRSATSLRGGLDMTRRLGNGDTVFVLGGLRRVISDSDEIDHRAIRLAAAYTLGRRTGPARLNFGADAEYRDYAASPYSADGRQDRRLRLSVTAGFPNAEFLGYFPTLTLEAERVSSNISLYSSETLGVQLGVRSSF